MKLLFILLCFVSIQSFGQYRLYAIRTNNNLTKDTFLVKEFTDSLFTTSFVFIQRTKEHYDLIYGAEYPNSFGKFFKGADNIWINLPDQFESGEYTPTLFNTSNVAASTAFVCNYFRIGNKVIVSGAVGIDITLAASTELEMSLPISSNLTSAADLGGSGSVLSQTVSNLSVGIRGDAANDRASIIFLGTSLLNNTYTFTFSYTIK